jgi:tight adherence protein B
MLIHAWWWKLPNSTEMQNERVRYAETRSAETRLSETRSSETIRRVAALISAGLPAQQAHQICEEEIASMPSTESKQFEIVWSLAQQLGGPVVLALNRIIEVFEKNDKNAKEVELAFAGPQSTSKLVMGLPVIALVLAQLTGMNPFGAIVGSLLGLLSVCLGGGLLVTGHYWTRRLLAKALPPGLDPGAYLDCVLIGLQAGLPLDIARQVAEQNYKRVFYADVSAQDISALDEAAELSRTTGAALTQIILASADRAREDLRFQISNRIARLSVKLMIPLGVAVLPAFILLSIVPIAISLLSNSQQ